jgi:hypothetical protein
VTMQTFDNTCDLTWPCGNSNSYTCPELIGADAWVGGCQNIHKYTDFWINRLCVPTGDWPFTPGYGVETNTKVCANERDSSDLKTHDACCWDMDGDHYFAPAVGIYGDVKYINTPMYGTRAGDCNDSKSNVFPGAVELEGSGIDNNCDGKSTTQTACSDCPLICVDGDTFSCGLCGLATCSNNQWGGCQWEPWSACIPTSACSNGQTMVCGQCGISTCTNGQWSCCQSQGVCTPGEMTSQSCNGTGTQTHICNSTCQWNGWGNCSVTPCQDFYYNSATPSCSSNPQGSGNPTLCLEVKQYNGAVWQYRVCKQSDTFGVYKFQLVDENQINSWPQYDGEAGFSCSSWKDVDVSYLSGHGPVNGAGLRVDVASPSTCTQPACKYHTGTVTLYKQCQ